MDSQNNNDETKKIEYDTKKVEPGRHHSAPLHRHEGLSVAMAWSVGIALLFLTFVTVAVAQLNLGPFNFFVAMAVATLKASLVALFFMNLWYDNRENGVIFGTSFLFLTIFIVLTAADVFFRGDVAVSGPLFAESGASQSKLKKPWLSSPEFIVQGKTLYKVQCVSCHGDEGMGNGPAATALNPRPRNFHEPVGWKNGRKPTMVFKTLKEGLAPSAMASYATLPVDERWALVHYVLSLGPQPPDEDAVADFAKAGLDPNKAGGGGSTEAPTISIEQAMDLLEVPKTASESTARLYAPNLQLAVRFQEMAPEGAFAGPYRNAARIYQQRCLPCHADYGGGGIKVQHLGGQPMAYVSTLALNSTLDSLKSQEYFNAIVVQGLPGNLMPGSGDLSHTELKELFEYLHSF